MLESEECGDAICLDVGLLDQLESRIRQIELGMATRYSPGACTPMQWSAQTVTVLPLYNSGVRRDYARHVLVVVGFWDATG